MNFIIKNNYDDDNDDIDIDWNEFEPMIIPNNKQPFYIHTNEIDNILDVNLFQDEEKQEEEIIDKQFSVPQTLLQNEKLFHHNTNLVFTFPINDLPDFYFFFLNNGECS